MKMLICRPPEQGGAHPLIGESETNRSHLSCSQSELVSAYEPLISSLIPIHERCGPLHSDLMQEGRIAVLEASATFDPHKGTTFATHAWYKIKGRMTKLLRMERKQRRCLSLDLELSADWEEGGRTILADKLPSSVDVRETIYDMESGLILDILNAAVENLSGDLRVIIVGKFWEGKTQKEIAGALGIHPTRIPAMKRKALRLLRDQIGHLFN